MFEQTCARIMSATCRRTSAVSEATYLGHAPVEFAAMSGAITELGKQKTG